MKVARGHAHSGNPLSQALIERDTQECVSLNKLHTAFLRYPFMHLAEQTKWTNVSCLKKQHDSKA